MNKKTIYIVVAVLVVVIVVGVAGVLLLNNGNNGEDTNPTATPEPSPSVADATSLQFTVTDSTGTYIYSAKNIGDETILAIEYPDETAGFKVIIDGAHQTAASNMTGTWATEDFQTDKAQWQPLFEDYIHDLADWTSGTWTSADGATTITDISVNPTLDDSMFEVPNLKSRQSLVLKPTPFSFFDCNPP